MSRPIAYNTSHPLSGSITQTGGGGSISYTIDGTGRDYTSFAGKKWVPSADGAAPIIFVTDSFTQGYHTAANAVPLFYACAGTSSAAILYTANRLPGSPGNYATVNDAITDLLSNDWFIIEGEEPFEGVDADNMVLDLDPSKLISYPGTGTVWGDISGKNNASSLINGPTFDSGGWFNFDGIDDYGVGSGGISGEDCTVELWISSSNYSGKIPLSIDGDNYGSGPNIYFTNGVITWNTGDGAGNPFAGSSYPDTKWHHIMIINDFNGTAGYGQAVLFIDGTQIGFATPLNARTTQGGSKFWIGRFHGGGYYTSGKYKAARIYNEALTEARVKQNYFGSPIVTDGLVFAVDANNIVSYPKSGTAWYNLTSSISSGSLINGPTFSPANGGSIVFDGTDDYIPTNFTQTFTDELTVETWYRGTKSTRNHLWNFGTSPTSNLQCDFNDSGYTLWVYWQGGGGNRVWYQSPNFTDSNIHHLVFRHSGSVNQVYFDGQLLTPASTPAGTQTFTGGGVGGSYNIAGSPYFGGNVYANRIYNKALSASEILQNYQAEQYRFETPAGPVTNGLVLYWDAGNLDSYPGTGTTIYDLSGNGNNGTLVNGVGFNQTNGGVLTFDGVDDVVRLLAPDLRSTNNTVMGAARYSGGTRGRMINAYGNNWLMGHWNNSTENYYAAGWVSSVGTGTSDTNWRIYSATGDVGTDSWSMYVNNSLSAGPNNAGSQGPYGISIGAQGGSPGTEPSIGEFSFVLVYNRILTSAEMTQNYNYFKGRFGL